MMVILTVQSGIPELSSVDMMGTSPDGIPNRE
jgi:hypothetical protein